MRCGPPYDPGCTAGRVSWPDTAPVVRPDPTTGGAGALRPPNVTDVGQRRRDVLIAAGVADAVRRRHLWPASPPRAWSNGRSTPPGAAARWRRRRARLQEERPAARGRGRRGRRVAYYGLHYPGIFAAAPALVAIYTIATLGRGARRSCWPPRWPSASPPRRPSPTDPSPGDGFQWISGWLVRDGHRRGGGPQPPGLPAGGRAAAGRGRAHPGGGGAAAGGRGAAVDRPGAARLAHPQHLGDQRAGRAWRCTCSTASRSSAREALAAIKEAGQRGDARAARHPRACCGSRRRRRRSPAGPRPARRAGRPGRARPGCRSHGDGSAASRGGCPPPVDRAAYRIVQESLTNVPVTPAGAATVRIDYGRRRLIVEVDDDGTADAGRPHGRGIGLIGMRERVAPLGGWLRPGRARRGRLHRPGRACPPGGPVVIRVLLADDQPLIRAGFRSLLDAEDDIAVVGRGRRRREAVEPGPRAPRPTSPSWTSACPCSTASRPPAGSAPTQRFAASSVVILTTFDLDEYVFDALRAGASGFLVKDTEPVDLLQGVRVVAAATPCCRPRSPAGSSTSTPPAAPSPRRGRARRAHRPRARGPGARRRAACPTTRSPRSWSSAPPPPRPTSAGS